VDDADRAQFAIEVQLAAQLERAAALARTALGRHATSTICEDCGGEIEPVRITYGFATCAGCAKDREYFTAHGRTYR
jgi:RNA polymerase-binding transcription factor DksA